MKKRVAIVVLALLVLAGCSATTSNEVTNAFEVSGSSRFNMAYFLVGEDEIIGAINQALTDEAYPTFERNSSQLWNFYDLGEEKDALRVSMASDTKLTSIELFLKVSKDNAKQVGDIICLVINTFSPNAADEIADKLNVFTAKADDNTWYKYDYGNTHYEYCANYVYASCLKITAIPPEDATPEK